ncbi:MAG: hypothetical protein CBB97_07580 [Candidatus Endolissoclinum sp. TMED37]|nr:MAG: hypothetical protein CBB97_07580 [Candidatus Endolissoclinum sp. TMED37]|tara:strand:+ start:7387 stop:8106 length:720 start_codon:yes stop_codon:yes gene_type:complete
MEKLDFDYKKIEKDYYRKVIRSNNARSRWHLDKFNFVKKLTESDIVGVLDIGSGPGVFLEFFENDTKLFGYDIAEKQLNAGRIALPEACFTSDLEFLISKHKQISHIFAIELIEHIDKENFNKIMHVVSKIIKLRSELGMNTFLHITTPNYSSAWPIIEKFVDFVTKMEYGKQHISKFTPKILKSAIIDQLNVNNVNVKNIEIGTFMGFTWISKYLVFLDWILIKVLKKGHLCYAKCVF